HDWAVHVALWEKGDLAAGAVYMPARKILFGTQAPPSYPPPHEGRLRLACSRTRLPAFLGELAEALDAELVPMGSAGVKVAAVIAGDADAYVHAGGQYEWDSAASVAVARVTGLHTSRVDGSPMTYNRPGAKLPDLLVCRADLAGRLLSALSSLNLNGNI
nr:3'(2'),5'-bisphosphate nucleotidase CysQ [Longispora sp. (in: high G+C Gram-positive bacteria)]